MRNRRFPNYPDDADYTTNAPSYLDDLARKQKLIELLAKKIWEYDERLDTKISDLEEVLSSYLSQWDDRIENLDNEVSHIFVEWLNDGTLEQIINHDVLGNKADQSELDETNEQLVLTDNKLNRLFIDPVNFGLSEGINYTENTQAIHNAIASANEGDTVIIPSGVYGINDTIVIDKQIDFIMNGDIEYHGVRDRTALHFVRPRNVTIKLKGEVRDKGMYEWHGWEDVNYIGVVIENAFRSRIEINVVRNFTVGVQFLACKGQSLGFFFNKISIYQLIDNKIQLENMMKDPNSWFNANVITDVFFTYTQSGTPFQNANVDRYCIKQTHVNNTIPPDTNTFRDIRFDLQSNIGGTYTAISLNRAWEWKFENYRTELVSNANVKFAVLNCETNQMRGIKFEPLAEFYKVRENIDVELMNVTDPKLNYTKIFEKKGQFGNVDFHPIHREDEFNKRYRNSSNGYHFIKGVYNLQSNAVELSKSTETPTQYATTPRLIENGVKVGSSHPVVFYVKNIKKGDTIEVKALNAVGTVKPTISVKPFINNQVIANNELIEGGLLRKMIVASNCYWDSINNRIIQSVAGDQFTFSINSNTIETVAILVFGDLKGVEVRSNNKEVTVLNSIVTERNNRNYHYLPTQPVKTFDGNFMYGDIVLNDNHTSGQPLGWRFTNVEGVLQWQAFGGS